MRKEVKTGKCKEQEEESKEDRKTLSPELKRSQQVAGSFSTVVCYFVCV